MWSRAALGPVGVVVTGRVGVGPVIGVGGGAIGPVVGVGVVVMGVVGVVGVVGVTGTDGVRRLVTLLLSGIGLRGKVRGLGIIIGLIRIRGTIGVRGVDGVLIAIRCRLLRCANSTGKKTIVSVIRIRVLITCRPHDPLSKVTRCPSCGVLG